MVSLNSRIGIIGAGTSGVYLAILLRLRGMLAKKQSAFAPQKPKITH
ncbi:hypothetical protein [Microcoleus sp.]